MGEKVIRHAKNVGTVPEHSVADNWPPCDGSLHPVIKAYLNDVKNDKENNGESARALIDEVRKRVPLPGGLRDNKSNCVALFVAVRPDANISRIELSTSTNGTPGNCAQFTPALFDKMGTHNTCGGATHTGFFQPHFNRNKTAVGVIFTNWSDGLVRTGTLSVYYKVRTVATSPSATKKTPNGKR